MSSETGNEQKKEENKQENSKQNDASNASIEQIFDKVLSPLDKAPEVKPEDFAKPIDIDNIEARIKAIEEAVEKQYREIHKKTALMETLDKYCYPVRYLYVCVGDVVLAKVGRYWYHGIITRAGKNGIVMTNQGKSVSLALGKISTLTIISEGEIHKKLKEILGTDIDMGSE